MTILKLRCQAVVLLPCFPVHDQHQNVTPTVLSADQTGRKAEKADQEKENRLYER